MSSVRDRLAAANFVIPDFQPIDAALGFARFRRDGDLVYLSGHLSDLPGMPAIRGLLGAQVSLDLGYLCAQRCALNLLASLEVAAGSLDDDVEIIKVLGFVAATADFKDHPGVINGASDVFLTGFGPEAGKHARSAIGVSSLPLGACVEVEAIAKVGQ